MENKLKPTEINSEKLKRLTDFLESENLHYTYVYGEDKLLSIQLWSEKPKKKNIWGADIEECNEFFDKITKNAGPRD